MLKKSLLIITLLSFGNLGAMEVVSGKDAEVAEIKNLKTVEGASDNTFDEKAFRTQAVKRLEQLAEGYTQGLETAEKRVAEEEADNARDNDGYEPLTAREKAGEILAQLQLNVAALVEGMNEFLEKSVFPIQKRLYQAYTPLRQTFVSYVKDGEVELHVVPDFDSPGHLKEAVQRHVSELGKLIKELQE